MKRKEIGIRLIREDWIFVRKQFGAEDWKSKGPGLCKRVQRNSKTNKILWEEDYYYSGAGFNTPNGGKSDEMLTVHYDYGSEKVSISYVGLSAPIEALTKSLKLTKDGHRAEDNQETLAVADKILKDWKINRLED